MATVGDLVVNLGLNRKGFSKGLQSTRKELGGFSSGVTSALKYLGPAAVAAAGAVATAFAGRASINAAREQIEAERKLASVIKSTGGAAGLSAKEIADYAAERQKLTNFGDEATIGAAAVLGTFTNIKGDVFKESLATAQDMSAILGQDLQSSVTQIGKALNDPIKGMTALSRIGVAFSDEQKAQIKHLQEQGDLVGAQGVILKELTTEFGGAAAGVADPLTQAKNLAGDIGEIIGFVMLPPLNAFVGLFSTAAEPIADSRETAEALGQTLADIVTNNLAPMAEWFRTVAEFGVKSAEMIAYGFRNASELSQIAMIDLSLGLFELIPGTETVMESIAGTILGVWDGAVAGFGAFFDNVTAGFKEILNVAKAVFEGLRAGLEALLAGENPLEAITDGFIETFANQKNEIGGGNPLTAFRDAFNETRENVRLGFEDQGLADGLRAQRDALESSIATNELNFKAKLDIEKPALPAKIARDLSDTAASSKAGSDFDIRGRSVDAKPNAALAVRSAEGVAAAIRATTGGNTTEQQRQTQQLARIAERQDSATEYLRRIDRTMDQDTQLIKLGEIP